jgi:hypothetical protein
MRLWGTATGDDGEPVAGDRARWLIDRKEVANGLDAFVEAPRAGNHRVTLLVAGEAGCAVCRSDPRSYQLRPPGLGPCLTSPPNSDLFCTLRISEIIVGLICPST